MQVNPLFLSLAMRLILVLILWLKFSLVFSQTNPSGLMTNLSISDAKKRSAAEGKLLLVYFHADWVQPCQWMKNITFNDKVITSFFSEHSLLLELNIENRIGNAEKLFFKVNSLPTLILFDASGNQLVRLEEALDAKKLFNVLQTWNLEENKRFGVGNIADVSANNSFQHLNRAPLIPAERNDMSAEIATQNYGILVKIFQQYNLALEYSQQFQNKVDRKVNILEQKITDNLSQYKIVVSKFSNREEASAFLPQLRMLGIQGEIIKL